MRRHGEAGERQVEDAVARFWERLPAPSDDELRTVAARASSEARRVVRPQRRSRLRTSSIVLAVAGLALLIGSGLGFGLASALTPSGSARGLVGFGFIPAQGWNVMQTGTLGADGVARAIAANVTLDPKDDLRGEPLATLRSLPPRGVLISATFSPRGDAAEDAAFPVRQPPFRLEDAEQLSAQRVQLLAGIQGYNVALAVHYGSAHPSAQQRAAAQRQLDHLVVAAEGVTMFARPTTVGGPGFNDYTVNLYGSVANGKAGESVAIQAKDCGSNFFRLVTGASTQAGGSWSWKYFPIINTTLRAVWEGSVSDEIRIWRRAFVDLDKEGRQRFVVSAAGRGSFWRKRVQIQRRDQRLGTWRLVRTVVLTDAGSYGRASATFRLDLPKGTLIRALMPLSQVKPCFVAGTSRPVRT